MTAATKLALVTGGSGFIGRRLVARLVDSNWDVVMLTRTPRPSGTARVLCAAADLITGAGLTPALLDGVSHIFHCAGELKATGPMRALHVDGTARLIELVCSRPNAPPIRWIQLSSVGAYGPPPIAAQSRCVDEHTPENPVGEYERTKTEGDHLVRLAGMRGNMSVAIVRPANVVGADMASDAIRGVARMVKRGRFVYIGRPGAVSNFVHVDDVAAALVACAFHDAAAGRVFNLSSDCTWEALVTAIAGALRVRAPFARLPEWVARAAVNVVANVLPFPLTHSRISALVGRTTYPSTTIESVIGFRLARPMPHGIVDVVGGL